MAVDDSTGAADSGSPGGEIPPEEPQIYAVHRRPGGWTSVSRRGWLAGAAGLAAASGCQPAAPPVPPPPVPQRAGVPLPQAPGGVPVSIPCDNRVAHSAAITVLSSSPDGRYLASADESGVIKLWGARPPAQILTLTEKVPNVRCLALNAEARRFVAADDGPNLTLWNLETSSFTSTTLPDNSPVRDVLWVRLPGNQEPAILARMENGRLWMHRPSAVADSTWLLPQTSDVVAMAVSFTEDTVAVAHVGGLVELRPLAAWLEPLTIASEPGTVSAMAFSRQGDLLAVGGQDGGVRIYRVAERSQVAVLREGDVPVEQLAFDAEGSALVVLHADKSCRRWPVRRSLLTAGPRLSLAGVQGCLWLGTGELLLLESGRITVWNENQPAEPARLRVRHDGLKLLARGESEASWTTVSQDGSLQHWSPPQDLTPRVTGVVPADTTTLAFEPRGRRALAGSPQHPLSVIALPEGRLQGQLGQKGAAARALAVSPGEERVAAIDAGGGFQTWSWPDSVAESDWPEIPAVTRAVAFSPDGRFLAVCGEQRLVVWACATRHVVSSWSLESVPATCLAFDPHGHYLLVGAEQQLSIWEVRTGRRAAQLEAPEELNWIAVSPSGMTVAGLTRNGAVCTWTNEPRLADKHWSWGATGVQVATLSAAGNALFVASGTTAAVWDLATDAAGCLIDFDINYDEVKGMAYEEEFAGRTVTVRVSIEVSIEVTVEERRTRQSIAGRMQRPKPPPTTYSPRPSSTPRTYSPSTYSTRTYHYWRPN
jgi:WD40 repeat protein